MTKMLSGSTKKKKTIIGIDYSLTSPAVCVNGKKFYFLTSKKKWQVKISENIIGYEHKEWTDPIQRFTYISDFVFDIISSLGTPKIFIEYQTKITVITRINNSRAKLQSGI